jgi:hypothetical protein
MSVLAFTAAASEAQRSDVHPVSCAGPMAALSSAARHHSRYHRFTNGRGFLVDFFRHI